MSATCDRPTTSAKVVIAGTFGVGKTTMITQLTDREPVRTEEVLTEAGANVDDLSGVEHKATTTVALDFGRLDLPSGPKLYLFGTPGQDRFWPMWDSIALGALGAIVIVDPQRLGQSFAVLDFFEDRGIPFVVAVNESTAHRATTRTRSPQPWTSTGTSRSCTSTPGASRPPRKSWSPSSTAPSPTTGHRPLHRASDRSVGSLDRGWGGHVARRVHPTPDRATPAP
nr:ATP/GTP-binding protein [Saccharopolyspora rhizosphaerae]